MPMQTIRLDDISPVRVAVLTTFSTTFFHNFVMIRPIALFAIHFHILHRLELEAPFHAQVTGVPEHFRNGGGDVTDGIFSLNRTNFFFVSTIIRPRSIHTG